jgi:hypothetical protein
VGGDDEAGDAEPDTADVVEADEMNGITIPFPNEFTSPPAWRVNTDRGSGGKYVRRSPRTVGH